MDNTCRVIMTENPPTLHPEQSLKSAIAIIHQTGLRYLPVISDDRTFIGVFSSMTLLEKLMPQSLSIHLGIEVADLNFMRPELSELTETLAEIGHEPVKNYLQEDSVPMCTPDDSIMEAIFLLHKHHTHVMILDAEHRQFLGTISIGSILEHIAKHS